MIIGLMGKAGSGKDTVGDILVSHSYRVPVRCDSFAAPIYKAVAAMLSCSVETLQDRDTKELPHELLGKSPRQMLQLLGTEYGRELINENIWVTLAMERHEMWKSVHDHPYGARAGIATTILTDVRFENEAAAIKARGGILVHIDRPGIEAVNGHISENAVDYAQADYHIINNGPLESLRSTVIQTLGQFIGVY